MEPRHLIRAAIALSVVGHLALAVGVLFADARPFDPSDTENIAVDVVTPEQVAAIQKAAEAPATEPPKLAPEPELRLPDPDKPTFDVSEKAQPAAPKSQPAPAAQPAQQAPAPPPASAPMQQPPPAGQAPTQAPPPPPQQAALQPPPAPPPANPQISAPPSAEPDITVKYGVLLGLPNGDGGAAATSKADIEPLDIAAFRRHLKSCSTRPAAVAPTDKVRIVLRAFFATDGRLQTAPTLIEASASAKGPLLMQAAMQALESCQPYAMLPADKYPEWKVLDLVFTPQDFS